MRIGDDLQVPEFKMATSSLVPNGNLLTPNMQSILRALERGLVLTRFSRKRNPERRTFQVKLETRQLTWIRAAGGRAEGTSEL